MCICARTPTPTAAAAAAVASATESGLAQHSTVKYFGALQLQKQTRLCAGIPLPRIRILAVVGCYIERILYI